MEEKKWVKKSFFEKLMNKLWWYKWQYNLWFIDSSQYSFYANTKLKEFVEPNEWQYVTKFWFNSSEMVSIKTSACS